MKFSVFLLVLTLLTTVLIIPPLGKAEPTITVAPSESYHIPELVPGNSTGSQPYVAGWMDAYSALFGVTQTRVTVSFPDTDLLKGLRQYEAL